MLGVGQARGLMGCTYWCHCKDCPSLSAAWRGIARRRWTDGNDRERVAFANPPAYENLATKTYSSPNAFPSALRRKRALVQNKVDDAEAAKEKDPIVSVVNVAIPRETLRRGIPDQRVDGRADIVAA